MDFYAAISEELEQRIHLTNISYNQIQASPCYIQSMFVVEVLIFTAVALKKPLLLIQASD